MRHEALAQWLVDHGLAEEERGYGHASGEEAAERLLSAFIIEERPNLDPKPYDGPREAPNIITRRGLNK